MLGAKSSGQSPGLDSAGQVDEHVSPWGAPAWPGYVSSSAVLRGPPGGAGVCLGIAAELLGSKCELPGQFQQEWSLPSCLTLHRVNHFSSLVKVTPSYTFPVLALLTGLG